MNLEKQLRMSLDFGEQNCPEFKEKTPEELFQTYEAPFFLLEVGTNKKIGELLNQQLEIFLCMD